MERSTANRETRIGVLLSDEEGAAGVVKYLTRAGFRVVSPDPKDRGPAGCDALILSLAEWKSVRHLFRKENAKADSGPDLPAVICCPADFDASALDPEEAGENTALVSLPVDPRLIVGQLRILLRRAGILGDMRYRLREREDVLRSISEVFFSVDHEFCYTFFNEKAEKVGGKTEQELLGKNMWDAFPFLKNTEFHRQMEQAAVDRRIFICEYLGPITGGWFEMRIYPSAGGLSALFVDISARKKAEESLKKAQEQLTAANGSLERAVQERTAELHRANERLEELLYSIAHDLRSPLRSMQGFAQAFVEDYASVLDERAAEYSRRMTAAAVAMDRMLRDLLELSRISKAEIQPEEVSLGEVWQAAIAQHEEVIRQSGARIESPPELGKVTANRTLLLQILANLLGNALKFRRREVVPEIRIWSEPLEATTLAVYVRDNGIGIDERYHDRVFRVFERLNGAQYEGTGIGLAIARKAADRLRGQLDFVSRPGEGTTFRLRLPRG